MSDSGFRTRCALAIDTSWHSSWHWPERDWYGKALEDAYRRQDRLIKSLAKVNSIIDELRQIVDDENSISDGDVS